MAFKSTVTTHTLHAEEMDWKPGSSWTFRRDLSGDDEDVIVEMTRKTLVGKINRREVRKALRAGKDVEDLVAQYVKTEDVMTAEKATLAHMAIGWEGDEFTLPDGFRSPVVDPETGKVQLDPATNLPVTRVDPFAGKVPPCNAFYIGLQEPYVRSEAYQEMNAIWVGKPVEERAETQEAIFRVVESARTGSRSGKVRAADEPDPGV